VATDEVLWTALGRTAATFDNRFGLPYLATPWRPSGLHQIPGAARACEIVAREWGGYYCHAFEQDFLAGLEAARARLLKAR